MYVASFPLQANQGEKLRYFLTLGAGAFSTSTITHSTIFECPKLDDIRGVFLQKLETILPETRNMTNADCLALLMGDDPPQEIENLLYRFLTSLFRRRLGILAAQGEGL